MIINCHSYYSLRYGTLSIKELLDSAKEHKITTLTLTDINNTSAALDFVKFANTYGIKPTVGIEFRNGSELLFTGFAKNNNGFYNLNEYLSSFLLKRIEICPLAPELKDVFIVYPYSKVHPEQLREDEFISILPHQINHILKYPKHFRHKVIALHTITHQGKERFYRLHKILRAIDLNTILPKLEETDVAPSNQFFVTLDKIEKKYELFPELLENAQKLINQCSIEFEYGTPKNKLAYTQSKEEDTILLRQLAEDGFDYRYGKGNKKALKRFNKELKVIEQLSFASYFLIAWDVLQFAKSKGYHHVGRGSGANSIIAYCLKITDVDPIKLDLYFERFINLYRTNPPDFQLYLQKTWRGSCWNDSYIHYISGSFIDSRNC